MTSNDVISVSPPFLLKLGCDFLTYLDFESFNFILSAFRVSYFFTVNCTRKFFLLFLQSIECRPTLSIYVYLGRFFSYLDVA